MLHVHNGDSSANILKRSGLPGEHLVWREALIAGPTPLGLSQDDWYTCRANHLADAYALDVADCKEGLIEQEEALQKFSDHEEVILWFEHDLFCQTLLIYLLDWFAQATLGHVKLRLICINEFPGVSNFRGLGTLSPEQMASLFETRHEVTSAEMKLGVKAWEAYCSPNPQAIEDLLAGDTSALPFLKHALQRHLVRFPSARNGLGRIENKALDLVSAGYSKFVSLFTEFGHAEPIYGLGDSQFWNDLKRLSEAKQPLLALERDDVTPAAHEFANSNFRMTEAGEAVRSDKNDFVKLNGIDFWLGGVHLSDKGDVWRWHEQDEKLVHATG
jgi:hypothetical protein